MSSAELMFGWEKAAREVPAPGVWQGAALHNAELRTPIGDFYGREGFTAAATARALLLANQALADPLLVDGEQDGEALAAWSATLAAEHAGDSDVFGPASGAPVKGLVGGLARMVEGRVMEAWAFDDADAVCRAAGRDPVEAARACPVAVPGIGADPLSSQLAPDPTLAFPPGLDPVLREVLGGYLTMVGRRHFDLAGWLYAPDARVELSGAGPALSAGEGVRPWLPLLAAMPDAVALVETVVASPAQPGRAALLWHLTGCHTAPGLGVPPTGRRLRVPVLSLLELSGGRIVRERRLLDRVALLGMATAP